MSELVEEPKSSRSSSSNLLAEQGTGEPNDSKELKQWLAKSNCQHHYAKFVENGVTFNLLPELDTASLKEIGINKLGDRLKLEISISSLKTEKLTNSVTVDELYRLMNMYSPDSGTPISGMNLGMGTALTPTNDSATLLPMNNNPYINNNMSSSSSSANKDVNKNITFILQDGSTKRVNVTGCFNAQSIKRKVLKRLGIKQQEGEYDTYIHSSLKNRGNNGINLLFDVELVTICYSPEREEKHRIIICRKNEYPSELAIETSKKIMKKYEKYNQGDYNKLMSQDDLSQYHIPDPRKTQQPTLRNFFGQRPPSELISSNLAEYFPEAHQRDLEATVRNSVRYSVRLSRRFNLPPSIFSGGSSSASIHNTQNKRSSIISGSMLIPNGGPETLSISSQNSAAAKRKPSGRTIGELMVKNINAIDEAVNSNETLSILNKARSIKSDMSGHGPASFDSRSIVSSNSLIKANTNHRISIAASFVDPAHSQSKRNSRIELFSIDSDDDDDFIDEYGTYTSGELDNDYRDQVLDSISEDGPRNWLQGARIGAGSFGTVYLGMNPLTGELLAVKQVCLPNKHSANNTSQTAMIEALQHEMSLLKELNHENIVRYLGSSTDLLYLNIFLEYVPGGSVQSMLSSYGPFEEPLIRNFIRQILIGLSYLHGEDIIHRDIKGANILIDIKGTVKISDFGISKKVGSSEVEMDEDKSASQKRGERRASLQGSVYWMAPEVVKQTAYTKKADIWSVGCLIVEMFTGKHPFPNFSQMQAIFKIGTHITPQIPEWCTVEAQDFLIKTFELDYEKRPDAVDMLAEPFLNPLIMSKQ